jgi:uncharacterized phage protein gp47/JayE
MIFQGNELFKDRQTILALMISAMQSNIPDVWIGEDGNLRLLFEVESSQIEGAYLANQVLLEDMFIQTANYSALVRWGDMFALPRKTGTIATGQLLFSGNGGTFVPVGAEVYYDQGGGLDPLYFTTTLSGTTPNPGTPTAPTTADAGVSGNLTGTYEYVVTFTTAQGESIASPISTDLPVTAHKITVSAIALGGPGTVARKIYRSLNAGVFKLVTTIADNTTTTYLDNIADGSLVNQQPPDVSTAESVLLDAQAETPGADYNAVTGAITVLSDVPDGITSVTNPAPFSGGTDLEDYEVYRQRLLDLIRSPATGSPSDLKAWAEEIDAVATATVFANDNLGTPTNGHTTVRVVGPNGTVVSGPDQTAVLAHLNEKDIANVTIHVAGFTAVSVNVTVVLTTSGTYTVADVTANVNQAIKDVINNVPVGGTLYVAALVAGIMEVTGIANVVVSAPAGTITSTSTQKLVPGTISIS